MFGDVVNKLSAHCLQQSIDFIEMQRTSGSATALRV